MCSVVVGGATVPRDEEPVRRGFLLTGIEVNEFASGSLEFGEVLRRISLELLDAGLAAEFDLLLIVDLYDRFSHTAEFLAGDEADLEGIRCGRRKEESGTEQAGEEDKCLFHR